LDFSVAPAWYQTNWFRILCVVSGVFIVWVIYRLRVLQISRAIGASFDERLAERTQMARDLHDTFLQTIQGSKLVADDALDPFHRSHPNASGRGTAVSVAWKSRKKAGQRRILCGRRPQTNDLAEAFRGVTEDGVIPSSMAVTFSAVGDAREMHPIVRDEVYRIGYEAVRNACMHSEASQLEVELIYARDLALRVSDNGTGIDPDVADRGRTDTLDCKGCGSALLASEASSRSGVLLVLGLRLG